jgi:8-oxo-dGTP diphosphatase
MQRIHVMAAVIRAPDDRILLARRPDHVHQGGLWEFPGGKREADESRFQALQRELQEELGITVTCARPLIDIRHDYPDKSIRLDVWQVDAFDGQPHGAEGQPVRWVEASELDHYAFPKANEPILRAARLPPRYLITPNLPSVEAIERGVDVALAGGIRLIQLRQTQLGAAEYDTAAQRVVAHCQGRATVLLKGVQQPCIEEAGWHLTTRQLRELDQAGWTREQYRQGGCHGPLAASCHNPEELAAAARIGVDFVTLSPVLPTRSHPDAQPLGWEQVGLWLSDTNVPAFVLGGLDARHLEKAWECGAQGIAGISGLWPKPI